jgi:tripartite-type tricarboxylate transporter receptor subunit TctC
MRTMKHRVQTFAIGLAGTLALSATPSLAATWPQRTVRLIVPVGPGTAPDVAARLFAERLAVRWKQPVVVDNRPGGDGIIGVGAFASMRGDHALLFSFAAPISVYPAVHNKLPYDPDRDVVPIASATDTFAAITASESIKVRSLAELVALARSQPGKLNCFSAAGALPYLFTGFVKSANLEIVQVAYREQNLAVQDLAEGRIQCILSTVTLVWPAVQAGKSRLLAVTNSRRAPMVPEVPTVIEAGYPELAFEGLLGLFGSREMSTDLRDRISIDVRAVAADPGIANRLAAVGQVARGSTPSEFTADIQSQRAKMTSIAKAISSRASP